jgi:hypothetical protein
MVYTVMLSLSLSPFASSIALAQVSTPSAPGAPDPDPQQQQQQQPQELPQSTFAPTFTFNTQQDATTSTPSVGSERPWSFWRTTRQLLLDPTTYAPAIISYEATKLDWDTSQVFFRNGFVEANARFTIDGQPYSTPVSYGRGDHKILMDTLGILGGSMANNFVERSMEQVLLERYPDHPKLVKAIGWIERSVFASYWSYRLSAEHFRQWKWNERQAAALGLK